MVVKSPSCTHKDAKSRKLPFISEHTWKKTMEKAGVVAMRKSGPSVSRAGRIPLPDAQSPDLTAVVVVVVVVGSCLTDDMMDCKNLFSYF